MMGDRLIGEAPEYTLEQWLRCDQLWPHVLDAPAFSHLQATLDALQTRLMRDHRHAALQQVFTNLMNDATLTPLFNYHYRISAPPGVNGVRLNPRGWFELPRLAAAAFIVKKLVDAAPGATIGFSLFVRKNHETCRCRI